LTSTDATGQDADAAIKATLALAAETPYDELIAGDIVWVGTPEDVIERIEGVLDVCEGLTEISITVNPGGFDHWQAIKNQELFAHRVIPHFKTAARKKKAAA